MSLRTIKNNFLHSFFDSLFSLPFSLFLLYKNASPRRAANRILKKNNFLYFKCIKRDRKFDTQFYAHILKNFSYWLKRVVIIFFLPICIVQKDCIEKNKEEIHACTWEKIHARNHILCPKDMPCTKWKGKDRKMRWNE